VFFQSIYTEKHIKKMKKFIITFLSVIFSVLSFGQTGSVERQVIFSPERGQDQKLVEFVNNTGSQIIQHYNQLGWYLIQVPDSSNQEDFIKQCSQLSFCKNVYKDEAMEYQRDYIPNDPNFNLSWYLRQANDADIDADEAWDLISNNGGYTTVAVFDGGFDPSHEDLIGNYNNIFNAVTNLPYNGQFPNSYDKHGVACSGTIAAVTNNGIGASSVGNNLVQVMPINIMSSVFSGGSFMTTSSIQINAINAAMSNPTCVAISMSYSGTGFSQALSDAFTQARTTARGGKGILCFASSGNGSSGTATNYPAWYSSVWGVGATNQSDTKASFSNFGLICDISAPGVSIMTTDRIGSEGYSSTNYTTVSGTSFSCPITAAAAALIAYRNSTLTAEQIMMILSETCDKVGGYAYNNNANFPYSTRSNEIGYGRINLKNAILMTPDNGGGTPPPITNHDVMITNPSVNPQSGLYGSTINISCVQLTMTPTLEQVNSILQYRYSSNTIWGDSDDIIIGTDTTSLGGGVISGSENITFVVPSLPGTKYILIRANFNNAIVETSYANNLTTIPFTPVDPNIALADISVEYVAPLTSEVLLTPNQTSMNVRWRFTNTGTVPITFFSYDRRWVNCSGSGFFGCVSQGTWSGNLLPGQSVILPSSNGWVSTNTCPQLVNSSSTVCYVPAGGSNIYRTSIISVNNGTGDSNSLNNVKDLNVSRLAVSDEPNLYSVDPTYIEIYTITGMLLDQKKWEELPNGIYMIKEVYPDETRVVKKVKTN
jgi:hypothetical protein